MSVYTFLEIDVPRQIEEMKAYLNSIGAKLPENAQKSLDEELEEIVKACHHCFSGDVPEEDIEKFLNSVVSVLIVVPAEAKPENLILAFCDQLVLLSSDSYGLVCLRVANLLFQALPEHLGVRYHVYYSMVKIASKIGMLDTVFNDVSKLRRLFSSAQPAPTTEQMQKLLRQLYQGLLTNKKSEKATSVMLELLGTYTKENASQAREDAEKCIKACLSDPETFILDHLLSLKPVKAMEGDLLHNLLVIFVSEKLPAYLNFYKKHKDYVVSIGLDHEANTRKMRLLTFIQMAETMSEISFEMFMDELKMPREEVESFIISSIKTGLVTARIDQSNSKVNVSSAVQRNFGKAQWVKLRESLTEWKENLSVVKDSMQNILSIPVTQPIQ